MRRERERERKEDHAIACISDAVLYDFLPVNVHTLASSGVRQAREKGEWMTGYNTSSNPFFFQRFPFFVFLRLSTCLPAIPFAYQPTSPCPLKNGMPQQHASAYAPSFTVFSCLCQIMATTTKLVIPLPTSAVQNKPNSSLF